MLKRTALKYLKGNELRVHELYHLHIEGSFTHVHQLSHLAENVYHKGNLREREAGDRKGLRKRPHGGNKGGMFMWSG